MIWFDLIWFDLIWFDLIWFDLIWFELIWSDLIWFGCFHFISFHLIWFGCFVVQRWSVYLEANVKIWVSIIHRVCSSLLQIHQTMQRWENTYIMSNVSKRVWKLNCKWPFFNQYNGILETLMWLIMRNTLSFSNWKWVFKIKDIAI